MPASVFLSIPTESLVELDYVVVLFTTAAVTDDVAAPMTLEVAMVDPQTRMSTPPARVMLR